MHHHHASVDMYVLLQFSSVDACYIYLVGVLKIDEHLEHATA